MKQGHNYFACWGDEFFENKMYIVVRYKFSTEIKSLKDKIDELYSFFSFLGGTPRPSMQQLYYVLNTSKTKNSDTLKFHK